MKVAAYIRVSTDGQCGEDKFGLDVQLNTIHRYCEQHNHQITAIYQDEGESGAKERPGFDSIVYDLSTDPPYEAIIVAKSDRVARDINIYYYYKMMLRKRNLQLISIAEDFGQFGIFSSMLEAFTLCVAEMERENINKRTSGGRNLKASRGGYAGGKAPMGYCIKDHALQINPDEAPTVLRIFELRDPTPPPSLASPASPLTLQQIADTLNKEGYRTRGGNPFSISTVDSILKNRKTYEGWYRYGPNSEWVPGVHTPILPRTTP